MKAPKQTQKQKIAKLENVYFQMWVMLKKIEEELSIIQKTLGIGEETGESDEPKQDM